MWKWELPQQLAFDDLQSPLVYSPMLAHFNPEIPVEIYTDASTVGLGAVLIQKQ